MFSLWGIGLHRHVSDPDPACLTGPLDSVVTRGGSVAPALCGRSQHVLPREKRRQVSAWGLLGPWSHLNPALIFKPRIPPTVHDAKTWSVLHCLLTTPHHLTASQCSWTLSSPVEGLWPLPCVAGHGMCSPERRDGRCQPGGCWGLGLT